MNTNPSFSVQDVNSSEMAVAPTTGNSQADDIGDLMPVDSIVCDGCGKTIDESTAIDVEIDGKTLAVCSDLCASILRARYESPEQNSDEEDEVVLTPAKPLARWRQKLAVVLGLT